MAQSDDLLRMRIFSREEGVESFVNPLPGVAVNSIGHIIETLLNPEGHELSFIARLVGARQAREAEAVEQSLGLRRALHDQERELRLDRGQDAVLKNGNQYRRQRIVGMVVELEEFDHRTTMELMVVSTVLSESGILLHAAAEVELHRRDQGLLAIEGDGSGAVERRRA